MFGSILSSRKASLQGTRAPDSRSSRGIVAFSPLTEGLITETHYAALLTAVATSGVNALTGSSTQLCPAELAPFVRTDFAVFRHLQVMVTEASAGVRFEAIPAFIEASEQGSEAYQRFIDDVPSLGDVRACVLHRHALAQGWRTACVAALAALDELQLAMGQNMPPSYVANYSVLKGLLRGSSEGFKPCLDARNQLFLPVLPQQRRWPRHSVLQACVVIWDGTRHAAFVRDASAGGLGLEQMPAALVRGASLTVEMACGRTLSGTIAWSRDKAAGLKFLRPLVLSDPLIRG